MFSAIELKREVIKTAQMFSSHGLGVGTSGNLSVRYHQDFIITPSGIPYEQLELNQLVALSEEGDVVAGHFKPSSEWRFHRDIYQDREEAGAIVHVHSPFATAISCTRKEIPAFHYVVAIAGGDSIRCADYATFGSAELSNNVIRSLKDRKACLLANHGMIAFDKDIPSAFKLALEVEELAKQYYYSLQVGQPVILDKTEMETVLAKFKTYGQQGLGEE